MKKIIVLSDSHGYNENIDKAMKNECYDYAIHCGDYTTNIKYMNQKFDFFVDGNNDYQHEDEVIFEVENKKILIIHGHQLFSWNQEQWIANLRSYGAKLGVDLVCFGHSHLEVFDKKAKPYVLNPGSISWPRNKNASRSYAIVNIDESISCQIKYL